MHERTVWSATLALQIIEMNGCSWLTARDAGAWAAFRNTGGLGRCPDWHKRCV